MPSLEEKAKDPKWRKKWAERNALLNDYLTRRDNGAVDVTVDKDLNEELEVGDRDYEDVKKAFKRLKKDDKRSVQEEHTFRDDMIDLLFPER